MNTATFPKIAEALRAIAALLDDACESAAKAAAVQPITPTYDNAKAAVINLGKTLGREAITELLAGFDAKRLPDVPESQWAAVIAAANARLEKHFFDEQGKEVGAA